MFHQFDQRTREIRGVNKGNAGTPASPPRLAIDQPAALAFEMRQGDFQIEHCKRDVVETLAALVEKPGDRSGVIDRCDQLYVGSAQGEHCFFHSLVSHHLTMQGLDSVSSSIPGQGGIEITDRNSDVVEVVGLHLRESGKGTLPAWPNQSNETSVLTWSGSPRQPPWEPPAGWVEATRKQLTRRQLTV